MTCPLIRHPSVQRRCRALITVATAFTILLPSVAVADPNAPPRPALTNQATYSYTEPASKQTFRGSSVLLDVKPDRLVDPLGRILGCSGELLPDYSGFSVSVHEVNPSDPTGSDIGALVPLTLTEVPDMQNNGIPGGLRPNTTNSNPFFLSNSTLGNERGVYNFLLDPNKGQLQPGRTYILVVNPPTNSIYQQRRVKIRIVESTGGIQNRIVRYVATSLDGQPISATGDTTVEDTVAAVNNAETIGLDLLALQFSTRMCQPDQVQIVKTGDRAAAEPGDVVIYRLGVRSRSDADLTNITVTDVLPTGFQLIEKSVLGELEGKKVPISVEARNSTILFRPQITIPPNRVLNIAYGVRLTPDAVRGSGRNTASVNANRSDNRFATKDGPATHQLRIRQGIVSECGTILGRVFEDKNFDGEQQDGEPGIPNAIVLLDDGNRISTDVNGLFFVSNVLSGRRSGVLDLSSVPGYTLAPNQRVLERNSQSRLVNLAPGGMVRMNFAVTPTSQEAAR